MPGLVTVGVLAFVGSWNGYLLPLLVISTGTLPQDLWPLPLGVTQFSTQYSQDTAAVLAYTSLAMIPALVFFLVGGTPHRRRPDRGGEGMTADPPPGRTARSR